MRKKHIGIIVNGVTGPMGTNQHPIPSIPPPPKVMWTAAAQNARLQIWLQGLPAVLKTLGRYLLAFTLCFASRGAMDRNDPMAQIKKAEGFFELGMPLDAWETIEDLPSEVKASKPVLILQLRILVAVKSWEKAEILAASLAQHFPDTGDVWYCLGVAASRLWRIH